MKDCNNCHFFRCNLNSKFDGSHQRYIKNGRLSLACIPGAITEEQYRKNNNPDGLLEADAVWDASCMVNCPSCDHYFDIMETDDWQEKVEGICISESNVAIEIICPACGVEFLVTDISY